MRGHDAVERALAEGLLSVDQEGRIWRIATRSRTGRVIPLALPRRADRARPDGYRYVTIGRRDSALAHYVVWWHAGREVPTGKEINHRDGHRGRNSLDNLECVTKGENLAHSYSMLGRVRMTGERNGRAKLSDLDVQAVRVAHGAGESARAIARRYGVTHRIILRIVRREVRDEYPA